LSVFIDHREKQQQASKHNLQALGSIKYLYSIQQVAAIFTFIFNIFAVTIHIRTLSIPFVTFAEEAIFVYVDYFVIRLYTTRVKCIITLLSLHVSALLGHHQVTNIYNYAIKDIPIQRIRCYIIGVLYYIVTF
jgi:hypothetical protein